MMNLLVLLAVISGVGIALYCMICERLEANRQWRAAHPARRREAVALSPATLEPAAELAVPRL